MLLPRLYKGAAPAMNDLIAGHIPMMFDNMPAVLPQVQGGSVRAIAVAGAVRVAALPDVPTVAEQGVPGFEAFAWFGLVAPAKTAAAVLEKLQGRYGRVDPGDTGHEGARSDRASAPSPVPSSGAAFGKFLADDTAKWSGADQDFRRQDGVGPPPTWSGSPWSRPRGPAIASFSAVSIPDAVRESSATPQRTFRTPAARIRSEAEKPG